MSIRVADRDGFPESRLAIRQLDSSGRNESGPAVPESLRGFIHAYPQESGLPVDQVIGLFLRRIRAPVLRREVFKKFDAWPRCGSQCCNVQPGSEDIVEALLLGTDLVKEPALLEAAYNDAAGVTAAFNRNVLAVVNRELHADFDLGAFAHEASWNAALERIEIRLRSRRTQVVRIASLGLEVTFQAGESILTEISRKFRRDVIARAAARAGLRLRSWHAEADGWYGVSLLSPAGESR